MVKRLVTFFSTVAMGTPRFLSAKKDVQIMPTKMRLTGIHTCAILNDLHGKACQAICSSSPALTCLQSSMTTSFGYAQAKVHT